MTKDSIVWHNLPPQEPPSPLKQWLYFTGSTTKVLQNYPTTTILHFEKQQQNHLKRSSWLICHNQPWLYAISHIPNLTLKQRPPHISKHAPLGSWIFQNPTTQRTIHSFCIITANHAIYPTITRHNPHPKPPIIWGRRSSIPNHPTPAIELWEFFIHPPIKSPPPTTQPQHHPITADKNHEN